MITRRRRRHASTALRVWNQQLQPSSQQLLLPRLQPQEPQPLQPLQPFQPQFPQPLLLPQQDQRTSRMIIHQQELLPKPLPQELLHIIWDPPCEM